MDEESEAVNRRPSEPNNSSVFEARRDETWSFYTKNETDESLEGRVIQRPQENHRD